MRRAFFFGLALALGGLVGTPASAQTDAELKATAEALFRDGMAAFSAGNYTEACSKLEGAVSLTRGEALGGALLLAQCYEKQGKTASAWAAYSEVAGKARAAGQAARADEAEKGAATLLPRLHYIVLRVPPEIAALEGASILRQGKPVRREVWTIRFPADPGAIDFEATAPGKRRAKVSVVIPDAAGETPVVFAPLEDDVARVTPPAPTASATPIAPTIAPSTAPPPPPPPPSAGSWSGPRVAGAALAVVGVAGMGAGIAIGALAKGRYNDAVADTTNCATLPAGGYTCSDVTKTEDARSLGDAGTVVFFVGAGATLGGGLLLLLAPSSAKAAASLPRVVVGRDGGGLLWKGSF